MTWGLLLTSFGLGLRHGVDWDHIAAIADLNSSTDSRRRGFWLSFLYAVGHGVVVLALGAVAIVFGAAIPESLASLMGRVVGLTLIALGVWVIVELVRHGRDFRLRSRWMLVLGGTFAGLRRVRASRAGRSISLEHEHEHEHEHDALDDGDAAAHDHPHVSAALEHDATEAVVAEAVAVAATAPSGWRRVFAGHSHSHGTRHSHAHTHDLALPDRADSYGTGTATGIGMLHGVGIESPTQIAVFVASTAAVGAVSGLALLVAWVVGLIVANSGLALLAGFGVLQAERNFRIYATIAVLVSIASIVMGVAYVVAWDFLPEIDLT